MLYIWKLIVNYALKLYLFIKYLFLSLFQVSCILYIVMLRIRSVSFIPISTVYCTMFSKPIICHMLHAISGNTYVNLGIFKYIFEFESALWCVTAWWHNGSQTIPWEWHHMLTAFCGCIINRVGWGRGVKGS